MAYSKNHTTLKRIMLFGAGVILIGFAIRTVYLRGETPSDTTPGPTQENKEPSRAHTREHQIEGLLKNLKNAQTWQEEKNILADLRGILNSQPPSKASLFIDKFLQSGKNSKLHGQFSLDQNGQLISYPTLRVALLDWSLGIDPSAAATQSRTVLQGPVLPEEWTVALRNITTTAGEIAREEIISKTSELLTNPKAQAEATPAFFEALDFLVRYKATDKTPILSDFILRKDRPDLKKSAFIALDGLIHASPGEMFRVLNNDRELQESYPEMIAQQMARADLDNPLQAEQIRNYLQDPERSQAEKDSFVASFPNTNRFLIPRIASTAVTLPARSEESIRRHRSLILRWITNNN